MQRVADDDDCSEAAFCGMLDHETHEQHRSYGPDADSQMDLKTHLTDPVEKGVETFPLPPGPPRPDQREGLPGVGDQGVLGGDEGLSQGAPQGNLSSGERCVNQTEPNEMFFHDQSGQDQTFGAYKDHDLFPEHDIMWNEQHGNPVKPGSRDLRPALEAPIEDYCATIDTGCQRMAIGQDTLNRLLPHVPEPLHVLGIPQEHRFKSVHGRSVTNKVAAIPTGLGHSGSTLRPAIFTEDYSRGAPFLISLPFLLHCRSVLHLDPHGQLRIHFRRFRFSAQCHLSPSGALRIRLDQFDSHKMGKLAEAQKEFQQGDREFEIYRTAVAPIEGSGQSSIGNVPKHGGDRPEQEGTSGVGERRRADPSLASDYEQDPLSGHRPRGADDRTPSSSTTSRRLEPRDKPSRHTPLQRLREESRGPSSGHTFRGGVDVELCGGIAVGGEVQRIDDREPRDAGRPLPGGEGPAHPEHGGRCSNVSTQHQVHPVPDAEAGTQLQSPILALPTGSEAAMRDVPVGRSTALVAGTATIASSGSGILFTREDIAEQHIFHPGGRLPTSEHDEEGKQWPLHPGEVPRLRKDPTKPSEVRDGDADAIRGTDEPWRAATTEEPGSGQGLPRVPGVQGVQALAGAAEEEMRAKALIGPGSKWIRKGARLERQAAASLRNAEAMWTELMSLIESADSISAGRQKLEQAIRSQRNDNPGEKRPLRGFSQLLQLDEKKLKTVAELYNPRRFQEQVKKAGMFPGEAFDLALGHDALQPEVRNYIQNYFRVLKPGLTIISAPCTMFSMLQNLNQHRWKDRDDFQQYAKQLGQARLLLRFAVQVVEIIVAYGGTYVFEHPLGSKAWLEKELQKIIRRDDTLMVRSDQCRFGLTSASGGLHMKPTGWLTNSEEIRARQAVHPGPQT